MPQTPCSHCVLNGGCQIYNLRPLECASFECSWLLGNGGGVNRRPDITGIVPVHELIEEVGVILILTEFRPGALDSEFAFKWTRNTLFRGSFVRHIPLLGNSRFYIPKGAETPTQEQHEFFEAYWKTKIDMVTFDLSLSGLIL